ncbi:hypothetical protein GGR08_000105 [Bartonella fuyuanensis]|uniref:Uncharacterized protein n=1 Tax=Bartonella fuyuanensis TaxID=1460968 RepID=A0A840DRZ2_9HYPH|nr:hypothetical protein [Bartonella fuyuanensis]MBB4075824.1 hypothetical protein [Bartonella fuyuanensis]
MVDSSKPKVKSHYTGTHRKKPVIEHKVVPHDLEKKVNNSVESPGIEKSNMRGQNKSISGVTWFFLSLSGILGGVFTLGVFIGLQWMGFFPSSFVENSAAGEKALQIAEAAKRQGEEAKEQLGHLFQEIDALKTELSSFSSQQFKTTKNNELSKEENKKAFAILEEKVKVLEGAVQTFIGASKKIEMSLSIGQSNANGLAALKQQVETIQEETAVKNSEKREIDTALFTAISSLKNAIERGGSYNNELKLLRQLSPSIGGLDLLQKTATVGLPSAVQLSIDFSHVADAIVGTQNIVASDAGFFDRILAWIKGLIVSRPIGNVEGTTLGAIAARMEVAIQTGDYDKALSEWQSLPQNAKDVSMDFVQKLERHITIQQVLQQLLLSVQQGSFKAIEM